MRIRHILVLVLMLCCLRANLNSASLGFIDFGSVAVGSITVKIVTASPHKMGCEDGMSQACQAFTYHVVGDVVTVAFRPVKAGTYRATLLLDRETLALRGVAN